LWGPNEKLALGAPFFKLWGPNEKLALGAPFFKLWDQMKDYIISKCVLSLEEPTKNFYYLTISSMLSSYVLSYCFILLLFNNYEMGFFEP
jgi:hypothetical protein